MIFFYQLYITCNAAALLLIELNILLGMIILKNVFIIMQGGQTDFIISRFQISLSSLVIITIPICRIAFVGIFKFIIVISILSSISSRPVALYVMYK